MDAPPDLPENRTAAWHVLAAGGTYAEAAEAAGVVKGTVSKWLGQWRKQFGADLFVDEAQTARAEKTAVARAGAEQHWSELRQREARNLGVTASAVRSRLLELLPRVGTQRVDRSGPTSVVVNGPGAREIKYLADSVSKLLETAELLDDRPTRHSRRSLDPEQWVAPLPPAPELTDDEKRAKVVDLAQRLRERKAEKQMQAEDREAEG